MILVCFRVTCKSCSFHLKILCLFFVFHGLTCKISQFNKRSLEEKLINQLKNRRNKKDIQECVELSTRLSNFHPRAQSESLFQFYTFLSRDAVKLLRSNFIIQGSIQRSSILIQFYGYFVILFIFQFIHIYITISLVLPHCIIIVIIMTMMVTKLKWRFPFSIIV